MSAQENHHFYTQMPILKEVAPMWKADHTLGRSSVRWRRWRPMLVVHSPCTPRDSQVPGHAPRSDFSAAVGCLENVQLCKQSFTTSHPQD